MRLLLALLPVLAQAQPLPTWQAIDKLIDEHKLEEASKASEARLNAARRGRDETEWTRALITVLNTRTALHGYEIAVRDFKAEPWPESVLSRTALQLTYANALNTYLHAYSYEIRQRERVDSAGPVDLKALTAEQLTTEIHRAYEAAWSNRAALGLQKIEALSLYLDRNTYPAGIRDTLRDAVSYLWVEALTDTSFWRAEQLNDLFKLDLNALAAGTPKTSGTVQLTNPDVHPLVRMGAVLDDLEAWNQSAGRKEAALEARLTRYRALHARFTDKSDRASLRAKLSATLASYRDVRWYSNGMATLAELTRTDGLLAEAHRLAREGAQAHPGSDGAQRCLALQQQLEAPGYNLAAMATDGPGKRSLEVTHKNLPQLYFRAYQVDLQSWLSSAHDYNFLPSGREIQRLLRSQSPVTAWTTALPATPDFENHRTFVEPPLVKPGLYTIVASAKQDFSEVQNHMLAVHFSLSPFALVLRHLSGAMEIGVVRGQSGQPVSEAEVMLYKVNYGQPHQLVATQRTDAKGETSFAADASRRNAAHFVIVKRGEEQGIVNQPFGFSMPYEAKPAPASLVFTDRAIYRPQQRLHFKVVSYRPAGEARFQVAQNSSVTVTLRDPNHQVVETKTLKTNEFGSAASDFTIPAGRPLGAWTLESAPRGHASVRVEEYKRPTFEASFAEPTQPMRLNKPATLTGQARYHFGLPVTSGAARWRVQRTPVFPWWWHWRWGGASASAPQVIATGSSPLSADGTFSVSFTPEADERGQENRAVTYRYEITADVTDDGGETRSASRSVRLGFVSVEATVVSDTAIFVEGRPASLTITRQSLDGNPRAGKGSWRLLALQGPSTALLPAEEPIERPKGFHTPGDLLHPRWRGLVNPRGSLTAWADGQQVSAGATTHDERGEARVDLGKLKPGAYRLRYETTDDFGAKHETFQQLIVAGARPTLPVAALLEVERPTIKVGETLRLLAHSGFAEQRMVLEIYRGGKRAQRRELTAGKDASLIELPIRPEDRGGFSIVLTCVRDWQLLRQTQDVFVPWDDKELKVELSTFRDLIRPGAKETWRVTVKGAEPQGAEVLAFMYDRSLDLFAQHTPPSALSLYPRKTGAPHLSSNLAQQWAQHLASGPLVNRLHAPPHQGDRLKGLSGYGIGGPGGRFRHRLMKDSAVGETDAVAMVPQSASLKRKEEVTAIASVAQDEEREAGAPPPPPAPTEKPAELRSNFAETAFWLPQLRLGRDGAVSLEFTVPDSVTSWNVWALALTRDLRGGSTSKMSRSVKDLMVRPYLPRFLREGDRATISVQVNNASKGALTGALRFEVLDPETDKSLASDFGLEGDRARAFTVEAGKSASLSFPVRAPRRVGPVAFKVTATAGDLSDGELRPLPVLPSRLHLAQSRFVTLKDKDKKTLRFEDMAKSDDPSRVDEKLVVTIDAQLFSTVLRALPSLARNPYECTDATLDRFVSSGIVSSVFRNHPAVAKLAKGMSARKTQLDAFDQADANRKMALEETPWLVAAQGGQRGEDLVSLLDPSRVEAERVSSLEKLARAQTPIGGFPWFPGGPPSPFMTLYIAHGLAKASEHKVEVPKPMVQRAWQYLAKHYRDEYSRKLEGKGCCWEFLTLLNYVASAYPDASFTGDALTMEERKRILDYSFKHWKETSPYLKGYLALTLKRMGRPADAKLVFDSVMDSAKTTPEDGTFWAPEDRGWLWYNDTIETHAFALRTLMELAPKDPRRAGLVQWLLINKKLNQWKSSRATSEVIYALVKYLEAEQQLGVREEAVVTVGSQQTRFVFEPDQFTNEKTQLVFEGPRIDPKTFGTITIEKTTPGFQFASATWHFATDKLPAEGQGDLFQVSRKYFKRVKAGREVTLQPLADGAKLAIGDELEVQLSLEARHAAEYVHLRDPRGAGFEPENATSRHRWGLGVGWYEEIRDSGTNFFFESLPAGEYPFKYRVRVSAAGTFRVGPATLQSMYAPEFTAYSTGHELMVGE